MEVDNPMETEYDPLVGLPPEASGEKSDKDIGCISEADAGEAKIIVNVNPAKPEKKELRHFWLARIKNLRKYYLDSPRISKKPPLFGLLQLP